MRIVKDGTGMEDGLEIYPSFNIKHSEKIVLRENIYWNLGWSQSIRVTGTINIMITIKAPSATGPWWPFLSVANNNNKAHRQICIAYNPVT